MHLEKEVTPVINGLDLVELKYTSGENYCIFLVFIFINWRYAEVGVDSSENKRCSEADIL